MVSDSTQPTEFFSDSTPLSTPVPGFNMQTIVELAYLMPTNSTDGFFTPYNDALLTRDDRPNDGVRTRWITITCDRLR